MANTPFSNLAKTGGNPIIFRSQGWGVYSTLGYIFSLGMALTTFLESKYSPIENLAFQGLTLFIACSVYLGIQRPALLFTDLGIAIKNPFTVTVIDWSQVSDIDTKFVLTIQSNLGITRSWAAAGPSRSQHRSIHPSELRGFHQQGSEVRVGDSPRSDSGAAAQIARRYIANRKNIKQTSIPTIIESRIIFKSIYGALALMVIIAHIIAYA